MSPTIPQRRIPRAFRRLELGLVLVASVFFGQLVLVSRRLQETETHSHQGRGASEKDLTWAFYSGETGVSEELVTSASTVAAVASRLKEATRTKNQHDNDGVSSVRGQTTEVRQQKRNAKSPEKAPTGTDVQASKAAIMIDAKKRMNMGRRRKKQWDPGSQGLKGDPVPLKISLPIFVPSLPKSGTTSIWQYFNCGGHHASHQWVKVNETESVQSGQCIRDNIERERPPFQDCGSYAAYTDTGFASYLTTGPDCYYPSIEALDEIYDAYPNSTFVHVVRDTSSWFNSVENWGEGSLLKRWMACNTTGKGWTMERGKLEDFYDWHTEHIRQFAREHPSLNYIEVELESKDTGRILEEKIGIPAKCWGKCTPASKFCKEAS